MFTACDVLNDLQHDAGLVWILPRVSNYEAQRSS